MVRMIILTAMLFSPACWAHSDPSAADDLVGEWAPDCFKAPSESNVHIEFRRENGALVRLARSEKQVSISRVDSVESEAGVIHLVFGLTERDAVTIDAEYTVDTSMRTTKSVLFRGGQFDKVWIEDGRLTVSGRRSETLFKCHDTDHLS